MSGTGSYFASAGDCIKIWDTKALEVVKQYNFHKGNVKDLSWSKYNNFLCSVSSSGDKIVSSDCFLSAKDKPKVVAEYGAGEKQTCVRVSPRDKSIYTAGVEGDVNIWDTATGRLKKSYKNTHNEPITCVSLNTPESHFASGSTKGDVVIRNLGTGDVTTKPTNQKSGQAVRGMTFSPWKHSLLSMAMDDGSLNLWDSLHSKVYCNFNEIHKAPAMDVVFSQFNDMLMASVGLDKSVIVYDYKNHLFLNKITLDQPLTSVTFGHDVVTLYVGSSLGQIYQLDLRSLDQVKRQVTGHSISVQKVVMQNGVKIKEKKQSRSEVHKTKSSQPDEEVSNHTRKPATNKTFGRGEGDEVNKFKFSPGDHNKPPPDTNGVTNGHHPNTPEINFAVSTPAPNQPLTHGFEGVLSPLQDDAFSNVSFPSVGGSFNMTGQTLTSSMGSYCDGVISPLGNSAKPAIHRTPNPGVQIHSRTSPHPLRQSFSSANTTPVNPSKNPARNIEPNIKERSATKTNAAKPNGVSENQLKLPQTGLPAHNKLTGKPQGQVESAASSSTSSSSSSSTKASPVGGKEVENTVQPVAMTPANDIKSFEFQSQLVVNAVKEVVDKLGENLRQQNNHNLSQMIKLFLRHEEFVERAIADKQCGVNLQLLQEIERLKEENEMLRRKYWSVAFMTSYWRWFFNII